MFKLDEPDDVGDRDGAPSWVAFTDKHTKRLCYYNMSTEEQSWEKPKGVDDKDIVFTDENHLMSSLPDPEGLDDDFAENNRPFVKPDFKLAMEHRIDEFLGMEVWNIVGPMRDFVIYIVAIYPAGTSAFEMVELSPLLFLALSLLATILLLTCLFIFGFLLPTFSL